MNFQDAIQIGLSRWKDFSGRSSRSEYWYWFLFLCISNTIAGLLDRVTFGSATGPAFFDRHHLFQLLVYFGFLIPAMAIKFRRLHDLDKSAWWLLLWLVPVIGWVTLIVWACTKGTTGPNRFGPDPLPSETIIS